MSGIGKIDLDVAIIESDRYALNALNAYLAWDRRTRVRIKADSLEQLWLDLAALDDKDYPKVVLLDANHVGGAHALTRAIRNLSDRIRDVKIICLAQIADLELLFAAVNSGARAFLLKGDVGLHIGWAIIYAETVDDHRFIISRGLQTSSQRLRHDRLRHIQVLPGPREYPGLTDRKRQALILYAIEGMSHKLIADEMAIKVSTVQGYIKEANQILESFHDDQGDYPSGMSQREITFMRLTALQSIDLE